MPRRGNLLVLSTHREIATLTPFARDDSVGLKETFLPYLSLRGGA
jgi:hypothetical protein